MPRASWQEVLIRHQPRPHRLPGEVTDSDRYFIPATPEQLLFDAPFRFDEARVRRFMVEAGVEHVDIRNANVRPSRMADSSLPTAYHFGDLPLTLVIMVGQCRQEWLPRDLSLPAPIWAQVSTRASWSGRVDEAIMKLLDDPLHDCVEDHVSLWPAQQKTFVLDGSVWYGRAGVVTLSFASCPLNPGRTLVMDASFNPSPPTHGHHAEPDDTTCPTSRRSWTSTGR